ncbi:hypothetical protein D9619_008058 [Psilocybe cf. subviscida]|uniref:Exonuclease 1 n=1 Tax=Psilocybe cf. subviscida TaxID=2480587 RepID=A0A8H5ESW5_9AGAR|nr:hypothetical protein D9619_008058 [Psilocybe cf. subviscida]
MGIAGLLNALKPIQVTRHLSEYAGKTVAVDAYGWLHKSIHTCATELATGSPTHKYVDYAMHRVRLLRHFQIEPYIVFDGGPLPAKKGTESSRKQKREENLARGKALLAQGNHKLAREHFVKSIDVTPQMAFQFIKALRAESVSYVVAPYEADAQLAYLERAGIVDAILTEDSDMLVFGCQHVLYKLDPVAYTVVSISRSDFGSVTNNDGISLTGWSDKQFRAWCILSGCDYLPNIPGIGIKTACLLLKKWRSAAKAVKAIALEGKKLVPVGYMKQFELAEMCFLHQRVYCPKRERLVHLTEAGNDWTEEFDNYVGPDLEPSLAKTIAMGNADPDTYSPMKDILPSYVPRPVKKLPLFRAHQRVQSPVAKVPTFLSPKAAGKLRQILSPTSPIGVASRNSNTVTTKAAKPTPKGGILNFFGPNPTIPSIRTTTTKTAPQPKPQASISAPVTTGKASGKRTLAQAMEEDHERREKAKKVPRRSCSPAPLVSSIFFAAGPKSNNVGVKRRHSDGVTNAVNAVAGPSRLPTPLRGPNKENQDVKYIVIDHEEEEDFIGNPSDPDFAFDGSDVSVQACYDDEAEACMDIDEEFPDAVQQEDGYISPSPSRSKDAEDLSSPIQPLSGQSSKTKRKKARRKVSTSAYGGNDAQPDVQTGWIASDDDHDHDEPHIIEDEEEEETSFGGADFVSSPVSVKRPALFNKFAFVPPGRRTYHTPARPRTRHNDNGEGEEEILVEPTPTPTGKKGLGTSTTAMNGSPTRTVLGPDLRHMLRDIDDGSTILEEPNDGESGSDDERVGQPASSSTPPSLSPDTPDPRMPPPGQGPPHVAVVDADYDDDSSSALALEASDDDARLAREASERSKAVLDGWREKWAHNSTSAVSISVSGKAKGKTTAPNVTAVQPLRRDGSIKKPSKTAVQTPANVPTAAVIAAASGTSSTKPKSAQSFTLRRSETNVTPMGRHALGRSKSKPGNDCGSGVGVTPRFSAAVDTPESVSTGGNRRSLMFFETVANRNTKVSANTGATASKAKKVADFTFDL